MARLTNPVPRHRRGRTNGLAAPHADQFSPPPSPFDPKRIAQIAVAGGFDPEGEPARLPTPHVVVNPNGTAGAVRTPTATAAPELSAGQTSPVTTPELGTVAPTSSIRSAATIHHEAAQRRRERALSMIAPLAAPTPSGLTPLATAIGRAAADPFGAALQTTPVKDQLLLDQLPNFPGVPKPRADWKEPTTLTDSTSVAVGPSSGRNAPFTAEQLHPKATAAQEIEGGRPRAPASADSVAGQIKDHALENELSTLRSQGTRVKGAPRIGTSIAARREAAQRPAPVGAVTPGSSLLASLPTNGAGKPVDPTDPLGPKTLGDVTGAQLAAATKAGTLKINSKGQLTTPDARQILHNLLTAHKVVQNSRTLGPVKDGGQLTPEEIGTLLVEEGRKQKLHLNPAEVAEGIGVAEAESAGNADEQRQLAEFSDPEDAHIGLFAEEGNGFDLSPEQRLDPREATKGALERFVDDDRSWNPAWVHWQEIQGEEETGADRAAAYKPLAKELIEGGKSIEPRAIKNLTEAKTAALKAGINPTPWNGDVQGADGNYVYIRADAKGALNWAETAVGTKQGEPRQLHWAAITHGPEDPWCSEFVGAAMLRQGLGQPEDSPYSGSWLKWKDGTNLGNDIAKAKPGDILVFGPEGGESEHVGIYQGNGVMISGNFSDEVAKSDVEDEIAAAGGLQGVVRPHYKGGKIKVKAGQLPGSSPGTVPGNEGSAESLGGSTGTTGSAPAAGEPGGTSTAGGEAALASFTPLAGPNLTGNVFAEEPGESEERLKALLAQAAQPTRA